jgi:tetratricopeptide (TPR) repeat protein
MVEAAWAQRQSVIDDAEAGQFTLDHIGMLAGHAGNHQLALQAFEAVERHFPSTGAALNVAVGLGRVGRIQEAVVKARACDPGHPRSLTILANLLWDAGDLKEAFTTYLRAIEADRDFLLPLANAVEIAARAGQPGRLDDLIEVLRQRFPESLDAHVVRAEALLARGRPSEAAELLAETLCRDGEPRRILDLKSDEKEAAPRRAARIAPDAPPGLESNEGAGVDDEPRPPDLSLLGEGMTDARAYYAFGLALLRSRQYGALSNLYSWVGTEGLGNGDWTVLTAEMARAEQQFEQALKIVRSMNRQPPPLITEALTLHAQGAGAEQIQPLLSGALGEEFKAKVFKHPKGNPVAVAQAIGAFLLMGRDDLPAAEANAQKAVEADPCCAMAWATLARALDLQGRADDALQAALQGLEYCPGDIDLVQWAVERYLDAGQFQDADALLNAHRAAIVSHGQEQFILWLGEGVARRQLKAQEGPRPAARVALTWPWLSQLQPDSRGWLEDAENGSRALPWLRLGIAIYFCKMAELELVARLIDPFVAAHAHAVGPGNDLRDLRDYLAGGRPPSIGGTFHALRAAAQPGRHYDSDLLRTWRQFVRSRAWKGATHLRSTSFLDTLGKLADVRKRVAHLGDLSEAELTMFRQFILNGNDPGLLFEALGIESGAP